MIIGITGDLHLNNSVFGRIEKNGLSFRSADFMRAFGVFVDRMIETKPEHVVIVGDTYENPHPQSPAREFLNEQMMRLSATGARTHILVGNHDRCFFHHALQPLRPLNIPGLHVVSEPEVVETDSAVLLFMPHSEAVEQERMSFKEALAEFAARDLGRISAAAADGKDVLFFGHMPYLGASQNDGSVNAKDGDPSWEDLDPFGPDYVFLGHFHAFQRLRSSQSCHAMYVGSLERSNFGDLTSNKGFVVYNSDAASGDMGQASFVPYAGCRPMIRIAGGVAEIMAGVQSVSPDKLPEPPIVKVVCVGDRDEQRRYDEAKPAIRKALSWVRHVELEGETVDEGRDRRVAELRKEVQTAGHVDSSVVSAMVKKAVGMTLSDPKEHEDACAILDAVVAKVDAARSVTGHPSTSRMRIHGVRMHNFQRYGTTDNVVEFDIGAKRVLEAVPSLADGEVANAKEEATSFLSSPLAGAPKVMSIVGMTNGDPKDSNGVGKTSVPEAVLYGFYGKLMKESARKRGMKGESTVSVVRTVNGVPQKEAHVDVLFSSQDELWVVRRGRKVSKSGQHSAILRLACLTSPDAAAEGGVEGHRKGDAAAMLAQIVQYDYDTMCNSLALGQYESEGFLCGTDKERKEIFANILRLDVIAEYLEELRRRRTECERRRSALSAQVDAIAEGIMAPEQVAAANARVAQIDGEVAAVDAAVAALHAEMESVGRDALAARLDALSRQAEMEAAAMTDKTNLLTEAWNKAEADAGAAKSAVDRAKLGERSAIDAKSGVERALVDFRAKVAGFDEKPVRKLLEMVSQAKAALPARTKRLAEVSAEIASVATEVGKRQGVVASLRTDIAKFRSMIGGGRTTCPECESEVTREHVEAKIAAKERAAAEAEAEISNLAASRDKLSAERAEVDRRIANINEYVGKEATAERSLAEHSSNMAAVADKEARLIEATGVVTAASEAARTAADRHATLVLAAQEAMRRVQDGRRPFEARIAVISAEISAVRVKADEAKRRCDEIAERVEQQNSARRSLDSAKGSILAKVEASREAEVKVSKKRADAESEARVVRLMGALDDQLGPDGVVVQVCERYIPLLNKHIADFMSVLTRGRASLQVVTDGKREGKMEFAVTGLAGPQVELSSSGQFTRMMIAVNLALGMTALERSDSSPDFVCLDEVIAPVDVGGKEAVFEVIDRIRSHFRTVVVISHDPSVQDRIRNVVTIDMVDDVSRVARQVFEAEGGKEHE